MDISKTSKQPPEFPKHIQQQAHQLSDGLASKVLHTTGENFTHHITHKKRKIEQLEGSSSQDKTYQLVTKKMKIAKAA